MNVVDVFGLTYVGRDDASILIRTQAFYRSLPCTSAISSASSGTDLLVGAMVVIGDRDDAISAAAGGGVSCQGTGAKAYMVTGVTWVEEDGPAISPITASSPSNHINVGQQVSAYDYSSGRQSPCCLAAEQLGAILTRMSRTARSARITLHDGSSVAVSDLSTRSRWEEGGLQ